MFSWISKWFKKTPVPDKPDTVDDLKPNEDDGMGGYFKTHRTVKRRGLLQDYIEKNAFSVRPEHIQPVTTGMDAGSNESAKNAFVIGQQRLPQNLFAWFVSHGFIGYQACGLIAQQWLVDLVCSIKGQDAVRNGYQITNNDGTDLPVEVLAALSKADKRYRVKEQLKRASKFNEVFGIRHILFVVDSPDKDYYLKPFNPDGIRPGSYKGMSQVDPYWITPLLDSEAVANPESLYFYEPTYWVISGRKYHRSHFVILRGPEVSDILKPSYIYGGLPLTQRIMERVYAAERTANEAPQLTMTKRLNVRKMDLEKAVANQAAFENALEVATEFRDNYGIQVVGMEEEVQQLDTSLTDLDEVIMTQYQIVAAVAKVPATKLLRTSPKGFNATGEHEIRTYHEELETLQETELTPIVEKHHICVIHSDIVPKFGMTPFDVDILWEPVNVPTDRELAEANDFKSRTDQSYVAIGAIDAYDVRDRLIADKQSGYSGLEAVERPEEPDPGGEDPYYGDPDADTPQDDQEEPDVTGDPGLVPLEDDPASAATSIRDVEQPDDRTGRRRDDETTQRRRTGRRPEDARTGQRRRRSTGRDSVGADVIREEGGKYFVYSESGKKLGGPYSKKGAKKRLKQVEMFKHKEDQ